MSLILANYIEDFETSEKAKIQNKRLFTNNLFDKEALDSYGLFPVKKVNNIFNFNFNNGLNSVNEKFFSSFVSGGNIQVANNNIPGILLQSTSTSNSRSIIQTKEFFNYISGTEHRVYFSSAFNSEASSGIIKREGIYYEINGVLNGFYFEQNGSNYSVNISSNITNFENISIPRNSWNDSLNGLGNSGLNINLQNFLLKYIRFSLDFNGFVEFGIVINQKHIPVHFINLALNSSYPFIGNKLALPIRFEILNQNANVSAQFSIFGGSYYIIGDYKETYSIKSISNSTTTFVTKNSLAQRMLLAVRLKNNPLHLFSKVILKKIHFSNSVTSNSSFIFNIIKNPTFVGGTTNFIDVGNNSFLDYYVLNSDANNPTLSGGEILYSFPSISSGSYRDTKTFEIEIPIYTIPFPNPTSEIIAISVYAGTSGGFFTSLEWFEYK